MYIPAKVSDHRVDDFHDILTYGVGRFHSGGLGIDADDGLGIALAQVHPLVGEVNLYTVDVIDLLFGIDALDLGQDGINICTGLEIDTVLGYEIRRIYLTQLANLHIHMCQMAQEKRDTYQCRKSNAGISRGNI